MLTHKKVLAGIISCALFTILLAACTIRDSATIPQGPTVDMLSANFAQKEVTLKKGEPLTISNSSGVPHIIVNGTWKGSQPVKTKEASAPDVNLNFTGGGSQKTPPFTTAGKFELFCTIHGGMNLTVTVQ